jgi:membrane dipeptidase
MIIVDAHQDLAYNIATFNRDYRLSAHETRQRERGSDTPSYNGDTLLGYPEYRRGGVGVIFATLFAGPVRRKLGEWDTQTYQTTEQAYHLYRNQMDIYLRLADEQADYFRLILSKSDLDEVVSSWQREVERLEPLLEEEPRPEEQPRPEEAPPSGEELDEEDGKPALPVGLVILMEGAEGVRHPEELAEWWQLGVRIIGPAWAGTRFCGGTREPGPLTPAGFELLEAMADLGFGLDISHMDEEAVLQALEAFPGTVIASHSNVAPLLKGLETNRHLSNRVIDGLLERGAVIGTVVNNAFLKPGWRTKDGRQLVSLQDVAAHIDYICQRAGDPYHAGLGSDFDGGYGVQSTPAEIDTIDDLRKLIPLLADRGYQEGDIEAIMGKNWLKTLNRILPEAV